MVKKDDKICSIAFILFGIIGIIMCIVFELGVDIYGIILYVFFSIGVVAGVGFWIVCERQYVLVENRCIKLFSGRKQLKHLAFTDVQELIICQISFHGNKNQYIVFDDGTFFNKKITKKDLLARKTLLEASWIIIDYSDKRFQKLKKELSTCPIKILEPDEY